MAKQDVIKNEFDGNAAEKYDKKYLKYLPALPQNSVISGVIDALRTNDLPTIEKSLIPVSNIANSSMYLLGITCLIIERERLYENTEFGWSYLRYAEHLTEELNIPIATISEAKLTMEIFIDYHRALTKAGFKIEKNASKLRYLPEALENHREEAVYDKIANSTFREFRDWAQKKSLAHKVKPGPDLRVDVVIKGNQLLIEGKNILNFPRGTKTTIKQMVANDLSRTFAIREGGNEPYIINTYGKGEQTAIENFLKKYRAKK
jgi:hypothetical protein